VVALGAVAADQDLAGGAGGAGHPDRSRTIDAAPLPEPVLPARSRIPAITGAPCSVLIVVSPSGTASSWRRWRGHIWLALCGEQIVWDDGDWITLDESHLRARRRASPGPISRAD